ncbi:zinc finger BED domain-containing protein 4-like [Hydra vulgaris]|uniref:Zinc finger BED domain-containing protein 4-like n=1 Tax=Hydra vulgaris TaxID=6087 RepID=A0ABM4BMK8_HYDVU
MHFPEIHTGKNISEYLHKGLLSFEFPHTKIYIVLRDNAANMVAGVRDSGFKRLATHFHHSPTAAEKLEAIQEQLGTNKHRLIQDVTTRWNSSYNMIERMLDQRVPLATYTADHATQSTLNSFQWGLLDKVFHILAPFKTLTVNLSKREALLSDVIPLIMALKVFFNQALVCEAFLSINTLVEQLKESVDKSLKLESSDSDEEPTVSDTNEVFVKPAYSKLNECFRLVFKLTTINECDSNFSITIDSKRFKRSHSNMQMINMEIEEYLKLPLVMKKESPLLWLKSCGNSLKNLKKIVQWFLSAPPFSV